MNKEHPACEIARIICKMTYREMMTFAEDFAQGHLLSLENLSPEERAAAIMGWAESMEQVNE